MMSQPTPNDEADSRFAGLAVAAAAAKERRARPQVHSPQRVEAPLPAAQEGTWLAQRKREREGLGAAPSSGTTTTDPAEQHPTGEGASLTVSAIIPIRLNEAVVAGNTEGSTITPLERLLRDMGVVDSDTIAASLRVQTQLGMYTGATKLTGNAVRAVVDGEGDNMVGKEDAFRGGSNGGCLFPMDEEDMDEERQLLREAPLSYSLRNHTTEAGVACEQAVASWTVPAVSAIATSSFLEAYARHAPGETSSGSDHSATFKQFFHNAVVSDYAHNNVATGVFPPGVAPLGNNRNNSILVTGDSGVVQPVFCRLPPPGAGLPIQASDFLFPGEMLSVPTQGPIFNPSTGGTRSSRGSAAAVNDDPSTLLSIPSSWMLSGLQVGSASMPLGTVDPLCTRAFVSTLISASVETKLRAKEVSYILQLLTPPPEDSIHLTPTPTSVSPNSASPNAPGAPTVTLLVHEPIIGITFRRHHWKAPSLVAAIKKKQEEVDATSNSNSVSATASLNYSANCRVNLLYVCGFLMSRSAPKGTGLSSSENTPPEEPLFALSDDSFSGCGIPPAGVVQAPSEAHSMSRSHFLSLVDKNKELVAGLLRHLFDIKHKYLESAEEPSASPAHQEEEDVDSTAHTIFNDTDRFYGRLSLTYRSCLQALLWLPVLVASTTTPTNHTATTTSPRRTLLSVDSTQLVVSEPLCYVIKVLSERDNEVMYSSTTTSASLLDATPMLGPGELASFVSASTSTLVSLCPPPSAPPTPTSMDRSPPPANSLIPSPPTLSPPQHDEEPVLMIGNEFGATATVQLLNTTPVKRVSSLETSTNTVNGNPDDSSRLRHQCQRSAQLLALLLNNIILKRARALHLWDSQQRRSMGSLSSGSSSPQALARAAQQVPDTHPSVLSSLFFDATVVELTSFALHFRSVKECTELFQTLKRF